MHRHSLHEVRPDAFEYAWDNSVEPVLELASGEEVLCTSATPRTSRSRDSAVEAVGRLDFSHVNPVSGPV